ncbi:MAG: hypothetical protein ACR2QO_12450 [Acidimicrobiales bacterium]
MLFRGPPWLIATGITLALGTGAGGGPIVNADGIDFRFLDPLWLAVALFVFPPAAWGMTVALITERLLHHRAIAEEPLPGVDARPRGLIGDIIGWIGITTITLIGLRDLVQDIERLT